MSRSSRQLTLIIFLTFLDKTKAVLRSLIIRQNHWKPLKTVVIKTISVYLNFWQNHIGRSHSGINPLTCCGNSCGVTGEAVAPAAPPIFLKINQFGEKWFCHSAKIILPGWLEIAILLDWLRIVKSNVSSVGASGASERIHSRPAELVRHILAAHQPIYRYTL